MKNLLIIVLAAALMAVGSVASAGSIGINMGSNHMALAAGDSAGVVAQTNWNNAANASGSLSNVNNNSGSSTTLDVAWSATGTWNYNSGTSNGNYKMMYGYLDPANDSSTSSVSLTQIPYATYDVYVYVGGDNSGGGKGKITNGTTTYSYSVVLPFAGTFTITTDTGSAYPSANYAKFSGLTGSSKTITCLALGLGDNTWSGIFGVQIVEVSSAPGAATAPSPAHTATDVGVTTDISWTAGSGATSHNVYFGTTSPGTSRGNQTATTYDTGTMANSTVYYWRIDEVNTYGTTTGTVWSFTTVAPPPSKATSPSPTSGAGGVSVSADLSWTAGAYAVSHDVYFGTSQTAVTTASRLAGDINGSGSVDIEDITVLAQQWLGTPTEPYADLDDDDEVSMTDFAVVSADWLDSADSVYKGNQAGVTFDPGTLANSTTYYWRIDEVNGAEPASPWTGDIWSFTTVTATAPGAASNPSPANGATGVSLTTDLSWTAGSGATSHNVYFGTTSPGASQGNQTATTYDTGTMVAGVYYWRIDEVNAYGTTTGTVWSFTAAAEVPLVISSVNPATYTVQYNSLATGQLVYIDRAYTFTNVASLGGETYIKTANDDKLSTGSSFLTFTINRDCTVYVAHDDAITSKPSWMSTFTDTGWNMAHDGSGTSFSLYSKDFSTGTVTLGGNGGPGDGCSMYSVVVVPRSTQASNPSPSDGATGVNAEANLSWSAGVGATSHNVYFGTSSPGTYRGNQTATTFDPGTLSTSTTYYWRIDEIASGVTTTGTVWNFTTAQAATGNIVFPGATWATKTPAELGCDSSKLAQLAGNIGGNGVIVRQGYIIYTWGNPAYEGEWASAVKPLFGTMVFFATEESRVSGIHDLIDNYGWTLSTKDQAIQFYHLANMTSGYMRPESSGAAWAYNDYAMSLYACTLFEHVYGTAHSSSAANAVVTDASRLGPLQFQDGDIIGTRWNGFPYALVSTPRDFARLGWFWCNKGNWNGVQLLPQHYFDDYMRTQVSGSTPRTSGSAGSDYLGVGSMGGDTDQTPYGPGVYGCNWWCNDSVVNWPSAPSDTVQGNGHDGPEIITIIPSRSVVLATIGGNMGAHATGAYDTMNSNLALLTEACPEPVMVDGYIKVDPSHPSRMVYSDTYQDGHLKPVCFAGPGDPEDFFWNNTTNNLNLLTGRGARCTYITAVLQDFGGPFNPGTGTALDTKLTEWEGYITQLENAGVITVFFFFDDTQPLTSNWQELVDKCVAKFKHHRLLIWSVAEEYGEALTTAQVSAVAARIKAQDDNDHVVGVHQNHGNTFDFMSDSNIDMFLMQLNYTSPGDLHTAVKNSNANGTKILNMAEAADHASQTRTNVRLWNWASIMGGASAVQVLWMGRATDSADWNTVDKYNDCARLMDFMESTQLNGTVNHDELARGNTDYVLANPGHAYIVYGDTGTSLGVSVVAGTYNVQWYDPVDGDWVDQGSQVLSAGDNTLTKPGAIGSEAALYLELE